MSTQHTPGPWRAVPHNPYETLSSPYVDGPGALAICTVYRGGYGETTPEAEANARLIAAAPELLQTCANAAGSFTAVMEYLSGICMHDPGTGRDCYPCDAYDSARRGYEAVTALLVRVQGED